MTTASCGHDFGTPEIHAFCRKCGAVHPKIAIALGPAPSPSPLAAARCDAPCPDTPALVCDRPAGHDGNHSAWTKGEHGVFGHTNWQPAADACPRCGGALGPSEESPYLLACARCGRQWPPRVEAPAPSLAPAAESSLAEVRQELEIATAEAVLWREREAAARAERDRAVEGERKAIEWTRDLDSQIVALRREATEDRNRLADSRDAARAEAEGLRAVMSETAVCPSPTRCETCTAATLRALASPSPRTTPSQEKETDTP